MRKAGLFALGGLLLGSVAVAELPENMPVCSTEASLCPQEAHTSIYEVLEKGEDGPLYDLCALRGEVGTPQDRSYNTTNVSFGISGPGSAFMTFEDCAGAFKSIAKECIDGEKSQSLGGTVLVDEVQLDLYELTHWDEHRNRVMARRQARSKVNPKPKLKAKRAPRPKAKPRPRRRQVVKPRTNLNPNAYAGL